MEINAPLKNEDGIALIIALMLLVLLTLLGMAATTTSVLEMQMADNDRDYKVYFYRAETAAYEAARNMGQMSDGDDPIGDLEGDGKAWIGIGAEIADDEDLADLSNWEDAITDGRAEESSYNGTEAAYSANFVDIYEKELTKDYSMRLFRVFGRGKEANVDHPTQALVELGLKLTYQNE